MSGILDRQTHPDLAMWRNLLRRSLKVIDDVRRQAQGTGEDDRVPWERDKPAAATPAIKLGGGTVLSGATVQPECGPVHPRSAAHQLPGVPAPETPVPGGIRLDSQAHGGRAAIARQGIAILTPFFSRAELAERRWCSHLLRSRRMVAPIGLSWLRHGATFLRSDASGRGSGRRSAVTARRPCEHSFRVAAGELSPVPTRTACASFSMRSSRPLQLRPLDPGLNVARAGAPLPS